MILPRLQPPTSTTNVNHFPLPPTSKIEILHTINYKSFRIVTSKRLPYTLPPPSHLHRHHSTTYNPPHGKQCSVVPPSDTLRRPTHCREHPHSRGGLLCGTPLCKSLSVRTAILEGPSRIMLNLLGFPSTSSCTGPGCSWIHFS